MSGARLFGREYEFRFGLPGQEGVSLKAEHDPVTGLTVGFDLDFSIEKTARKSSNKATFTIYNLSDDNIGKLEEKGTVVQFIAGYRSNKALLFTGTVRKRGVITEWEEGKTKKTTVEAGDGELEMARTRANISLAPGSTNIDAIKLLLGAMGVGLGNAETLPVKTLLGGYYHAGWAREALTELCADVGRDWSVQNGEFQSLSPNEIRQGEEAVLLTEETGLVNSPKKEKNGVEAQSLLQPRLQPGGLVRIECRAFKGDYKITEVTHEGGFPKGNWHSNIKGKERAA